MRSRRPAGRQEPQLGSPRARRARTDLRRGGKLHARCWLVSVGVARRMGACGEPAKPINQPRPRWVGGSGAAALRHVAAAVGGRARGLRRASNNQALLSDGGWGARSGALRCAPGGSHLARGSPGRGPGARATLSRPSQCRNTCSAQEGDQPASLLRWQRRERRRTVTSVVRCGRPLQSGGRRRAHASGA